MPKVQGPVVPSIVSLTSSLVVKMLTVLVSTISNSQVFLLKKNVSSLLTFFSKIISVYAIFNDQSFNDTLTNDIVSFEQLGLGCYNDKECKSGSFMNNLISVNLFGPAFSVCTLIPIQGLLSV